MIYCLFLCCRTVTVDVRLLFAHFKVVTVVYFSIHSVVVVCTLIRVIALLKLLS